MVQEKKDAVKNDLDKLIEINNFINSERDLERLFQLVLNYALQLTKAEYGFVILLDEKDPDEVHVQASLHAKEGDEDKISTSIITMAVERGEIISSANALQDERFDHAESIVLNELKSVLCLPIKSQNHCVGVFYLDNHYQTHAFENTNLTLLKAFCDQVGIAIENAKLFQKLNTAQEKLTNRLQETENELSEVKQILQEESVRYRAKYSYRNIISKSKGMQEIFRVLDKVTETNLAIFIHGASGTGKELFAKALHYNHPSRKKCHFIAVNCGAIPANLIESELFGHKAGSFTGAIRDKKGMFEEANGGTLFLDEIGELPLELQVKLLRVLQEGEVQRIGDNHTIKVDVRMISASHRQVEKMVQEKTFREDLYYRLCQMKVSLPPLRDRKEDIPDLAKHFVKKYLEQNDLKKEISIPPEFMKALLEYDWPGNVRELENAIAVACAMEEDGHLSLKNIPSHCGIVKQDAETQLKQIATPASSVSSGPVPNLPKTSQVKIDQKNYLDLSKSWRDYEALILAKCYQDCGYKKKLVAEKLGLSHSTVYKKIEEMGLDDTNHPLYSENFDYEDGLSMKDYVMRIFEASFHHHGQHPYAAIKSLGVSQGYFYKIMKNFHDTKQQEAAPTI